MNFSMVKIKAIVGIIAAGQITVSMVGVHHGRPLQRQQAAAM
jgi:hypothetical protein